jgi:hypothetical protein
MSRPFFALVIDEKLVGALILACASDKIDMLSQFKVMA